MSELTSFDLLRIYFSAAVVGAMWCILGMPACKERVETMRTLHFSLILTFGLWLCTPVALLTFERHGMPWCIIDDAIVWVCLVLSILMLSKHFPTRGNRS